MRMKTKPPVKHPTETLNFQIGEWFDVVVSYIASFVEDKKMADKMIGMVRKHGRMMYQLGYADGEEGHYQRFKKEVK